jgi:hypothetical protein
LITIIGDSWGCGEWNSDGLGWYGVTHKGLEQYLSDAGYAVENLSQGNFQNAEALDRFENYLKNNPAPALVVWFVTCVLRTPIAKIADPFEFGITQLNKSFEHINQLAREYNTKIYALGGLCDLPNKLVQAQFDNLIVLIPSVSSLVLENFPKSMFGDAKELFKITSKESALQVASLIEQKYDIFKTSSFFPDFGHPNRQVHQLIFEKIKPYV